MKSPLTQKPSIKEKASSTRSNTPAVDASRVVASGDQPGFMSLADNNISKFRVPFETLCSVPFSPRFMIQSKKEELLLRLSELFFFLRRLELCLVDLCLKDFVDKGKLSILADEVGELKGVAREALAYFHEAAKAVEPPFHPSSNDSPESVDECQSDGSKNHDENALGDISPVKPSQEVPHDGENIL